MEKVFEEFRARFPDGIREEMIKFWMSDENMTREESLEAYGDKSFDDFVERVAGEVCDFKPDLGYRGPTEGTICFEVIDNNICIPVCILEDIELINP